ncbi:hypothetical protein IW262DRAFT_1056471 [Armillaria fumosa]|nr:hypothetical protein IW262DRAFT_1056471 [Armillaria fumosa]
MPAPLLICALCVTSYSSCLDVINYFQKSVVYRRTLMRNAIRGESTISSSTKRKDTDEKAVAHLSEVNSPVRIKINFRIDFYCLKFSEPVYTANS